MHYPLTNAHPALKPHDDDPCEIASFRPIQARSDGMKPNAFANTVARLFFPQTAQLRLDFSSFSPRLQQRIVYAGANTSSFANASRDFFHLLDLRIDPKHFERLTHRIGQERIDERDAICEDWLDMTLTERDVPEADIVAPDLAVVEMDGGRLQVRSDAPSHGKSDTSHWKEDKIGVLLSMTSQTHEVDPCPEIPDCFVNPQYATQLAVEVGHVTLPVGEIPPAGSDDQPPTRGRPGLPEPLVKSVIATRHTVEDFGPLLASAAHERNFQGTKRQAFIADGSSANEGVRKRYFPRYVSILDFIHALSYVYSGAMAGRSFAEGWPIYCEWIQWIWSGEVGRVIAALESRQGELGVGAPEESESRPVCVVGTSLVYLINHSSQMDYASYRREGLPLMSSAVESTIKQINARVKGTEKFWSDGGSEAVLQLRSDYLSETDPMSEFWTRRQERLNGFRPYRNAG